MTYSCLSMLLLPHFEFIAACQFLQAECRRWKRRNSINPEYNYLSVAVDNHHSLVKRGYWLFQGFQTAL